MRATFWGGLFLTLFAPRSSLLAQCPDGTPPPCTRPAARPPVRPAVAMDQRTWIVLPFENLARAADLDWLKDASVNLLYMDLSRWTDVRAVDDKRVADFLRDVPAARANQRLSLNDGLGVARRAGAGKLVMGEFLKVGSRTAVTATVYDARNGTRIRSVRRETAVVDSLMPLFGQVASGLLAVPPPAGANVGSAGTSRADAYQEYLAGVAALNRFDAPTAIERLAKALTLDSAFALAHYQLAIASLYDAAAANARAASKITFSNPSSAVGGGIDTVRLTHALAAARLGTTLPERERALINGLLAHTRQDYRRACQLYGSVVKADSNDVEALYGVGRCSYYDDAVEDPGGGAPLRFRSSWNTTLKVLRRALAIDPGFHLPFDNILSVLSASSRTGCRREAPDADCAPTAQRYVGSVRRDGDSLVIVPVPVSMSVAILAQVTDARRSAARRQNLETARAAAEDWVAAGPGEGRAHRTLGLILLKLGRLAEASREVEEAARLLPFDAYSELPWARLEIALKQGRTGEAVRISDSVRTAASGQPEAVRLSTEIVTGTLVGRMAGGEAALRAGFRQQPGMSSIPPVITDYLIRASRVVLGQGGDSTVALERVLLPLVAADGICRSRCLSLLQTSWIFGLRLTRDKWPGFDSSASRDRRLGPAVAVASGDTGAIRKAAVILDSAAAEDARLAFPEDGSSLVAADAFLLLGDSARALRVIKRMTDTTLLFTPLGAPVSDAGLAFTGALWPRAYLLRAELEEAVGDRERAKQYYRMFAELWVGADPEFAGIVARARSKM